MANGFRYEDYFLAKYPVPPEYCHYLTHHYNLYYQNIPVELHYDLGASKYLGLTPEDINILWKHTRTIGDANIHLASITPELHLVLLALHDVFQHQKHTTSKDFRLYRTFDLYLLIQHSPIDWALVAEYSADLHAQAHVIQALYQVEHLFSLPDLAEAIALLTSSETEHNFYAEADLSLILVNYNTLKIARKIIPITRLPAYFWHYVLFPEEKAMRYEYQVADDHPILPYYIRRMLENTRTVLRFGWRWIINRTSRFMTKSPTQI